MKNKSNIRLELGQGLVEYALIVVLLAVFIILGLTFLGNGIGSALYNNIISSL